MIYKPFIMKAIGVLLLVVLLSATIHFSIENQALQQALTSVSDTLRSQRLQQEWMENSTRSRLAGHGEMPLQIIGNCVETHRITANYDNGLFLLRIERRTDGSLTALYKKIKAKQPFPADLKLVEFTVDTASQTLQARDLEDFKSQLAKADLLEASVQNDLLCCFGGGTLSWEAIMPDGNRHYFSTYCHQSAAFTAACTKLLLHIDDPELTRALR